MIANAVRRTFQRVPFGVLAAAVAAVLLTPTSGFATEAPAVKYFVEVHLAAPVDLQRLSASNFDVAGVDRPRNVAGVVTTPEELERLAAEGFCFDVKERNRPLRDRGEALANYSDPQEILAFMTQVEADHPTLARKILLQGVLFEGQQQFAMKITSGVDLPNHRPSFILDAQHHAREVMGPEIAMDAIEYLTSRYGTDPQVTAWLDRINVYVVPSVNPDGAMHVFQQDNMWRKNRNPACGAGVMTGVDLNRNYRFNWNGCAGSSGDCESLVYRGTAPASEPETRGMEGLLDEARALFALTIHSYGEYIVYPYGCTSWGQVSGEQDLFEAVGARIVAVLQNDDGRVNSYGLTPSDGIDGMAQDTYYGNYGSYAFLIEVGRSFQPDYATLRDVTVTRFRKAWQTLLDETLTAPQITGKVTDARSGEPLAATVILQELPLSNGELPRRANSRGHFNILTRNGTTVHATFSLPGYCSAQRVVAVGNGPSTLDVALEPSDSGVPESPQPAPGATNLPLATTLTWSWPGAVSFDVYFGTLPDPPQVATVTGNSWSPGPLETGRTYYWRVATAASCGGAPGPVWSFSTRRYEITGVAKLGNPFRLVVTGSGFTNQCAVNVGGVSVPVTAFKGSTKLVAKGGAALKAMVPRGSTVTITVEGPGGGISNAFNFRW
jgi:hypothetical protein